jgi:hypothetical protein
MQTVKTHTLIVRGVSKSVKNKLKRVAKGNRLSVNSTMLHAIDYYLGNETSVNKEIQNENIQAGKVDAGKVKHLEKY